MNWFMDLGDTQEKIEQFRVDYKLWDRILQSTICLLKNSYIYIKLNPKSLVKTVTNEGRLSVL